MRISLAAVLLALAATQAAAEPIRIVGTGTAGISIDDGPPLPPAFAVGYRLDLEVAEPNAPIFSPPFPGPPTFHVETTGALVLSAPGVTFVLTEVDLFADTFLLPPDPNEPVPTMQVLMYAQTIASPTFLEGIPNVPAGSILQSFEIDVTTPYSPIFDPNDPPTIGEFFALPFTPQTMIFSGFTNPQFRFQSPIEDFAVSTVPEPGSGLLAALALGALAALGSNRAR
jgi:hypothetical protein